MPPLPHHRQQNQRGYQRLVSPPWRHLLHFESAQHHLAAMGDHSVLSRGRLCLESVIGVFQIGFQWTGFTIVFILFLLYFPEHRKRAPHLPHSLHLDLPGPTTRSEEWRVSLGVAIACALHLILSVAISAYLLVSDDRQRTAYWAGFLGVSSMILAAFQYMPQIWKTWKRKGRFAMEKTVCDNAEGQGGGLGVGEAAMARLYLLDANVTDSEEISPSIWPSDNIKSHNFCESLSKPHRPSAPSVFR
ncbi:hypothetical protein BC936DRAFT_141202 [Jimgerdemannia flammicorona]|uniref:PQ loop repeat-domain-containing protein n=1 Tax=Jimgerdemannia flammicorona TaxID=994334 RepID=A0A433A2P0_9FUNG|nr:hypothetical protein BC936DRAFT_141202 [Jimgerdemannia flammicorona]